MCYSITYLYVTLSEIAKLPFLAYDVGIKMNQIPKQKFYALFSESNEIITHKMCSYNVQFS